VDDDDDLLLRYPRTAHLMGSRLQVGDTTEGQISVVDLNGDDNVWEEKVDGSNTGISFSVDADLRLQSRGHFLIGGWREKQYNLLKTWTQRHIDALFDILGRRYIMYGEWCYAKHTVYYDRLSHYFLEFDIYDREQQVFLGTDVRHRMLAGSPIVSVPVVHRGGLKSDQAIRRLVQPSLYKSVDWLAVMQRVARAHGIDPQQAIRETDASALSEGLYLKVERNGRVIGRYKFVRPDFLQAILDSGSHWNTRPILPNQLAPDVDIFA
jgi:hypothetical protein